MAMFIKRKTNIFFKYILIISAIILISFIVLGSSLMIFTIRYWRDERCSLLSVVAEKVATATETKVDIDTLELSRESILYLSDAMDLLGSSVDADVFISNLNGQIIVCKHTIYSLQQSFECVHMKAAIPTENIDQVISANAPVYGALDAFNRVTSYSVGVPITVNGQVAGVVFAVTPHSSVNTYVSNTLKLLLISTAFALVIAFMSTYLMTYKMITPLRQMAAATSKFSHGDFSTRIEITTNDEIGDLVTAFNSMASSLANTEATRRSFVANVSHELRTPMTSIGGFIDGILDGTIPPEREGYYLKIVSDETKRLSRLVVQMLNMSEVEAGKKKIQPTTFDISKSIFQAFVSFEARVNEKMIEIRGFENMQNIQVEADSDMIYQCIYNLVDNAIKFTNVGGYIEAKVATAQKRVIVSIKNSGEGLSPEEAHRVFERFYKVDKSRSQDVKGTGIGLYLVKSFVELHGGQVTVQSIQGEFCEFIFWLPLKFESNSSGK